MTLAQSSKYFAEFGKLRDVLRARGWSGTRIERHRHALTKKALGVDKSSKDFTNADLDKVLAVITAERAPADFNAQMAIQDMPEKRFSLLLHRIEGLAAAMGVEGNYVDGISRRMFDCQYHDCDERGLQQIEGVLRRKLRNSKLTVEQIAEIERHVADEAAGMVAIVTPSIERQAAAVHSEAEPFF